MAAWLRSAGAPGRRSTISMPLLLQTAEVPRVLQACVCITVQTSMQPMYAIRTETKSLLFAVVSGSDKEPRHYPDDAGKEPKAISCGIGGDDYIFYSHEPDQD